MSQPQYITALDLVEMPREQLSEEVYSYFVKCEEKIGFVPNVLRAYAFDERKLQPFIEMYDELMLGKSELSKLEREMIAVVVSSVNRCFYCLVAHGNAVRRLSKDPVIGDLLVMNYRTAELEPAQMAMLDFAVKLTETPNLFEESDRQHLRNHGFSDQAIWDICAVTGFFNMSNRVATGTDMQPNQEYHKQFR